MIERFSTRGLHIADRKEYWNGLLSGTYGGLAVEPVQPHFHAQMARWQLGDMMMIWPHSAAAAIGRRRCTSTNPKDRKIISHLMHAGGCRLTQRGREVELEPGDMVLCTDEEAYQFDCDREHQVLVVEMDRSALEQRVGNLDDLIATPISGQQVATRVMHNFILSLWREGAANFDESLETVYTSSLAELLGASLRSRGPSTTFERNQLFERMKGVVEAQLANADLSLPRLASELGVSVRKLQSSATAAGTTVVSYITERRLTRAAQLLAVESDLSVTKVAYSVGFSDSAYFSRRFHDRFGLSPSQYRQRH